tara:strand:+ start:191 stop:1738 length:1548 start_codon:yes stop_codon:yes gene_type:complete
MGQDLKIKVGKNVLETLTTAMYENPLFVYREYIQNSVDQIDQGIELGLLKSREDGNISISIDKFSGTISIKDNGTGVSEKEVLEILGNIALSTKERSKDRGFRGIGRLGGIGYCQTLKFITSFKGEDVQSVFEIDCKKLKNLLYDKKVTLTVEDLMYECINIEQHKEKKDEVYFIVYMEEITNNILLDEDKVKDYIQQVSPVPYNPSFRYKKKIHDYIDKEGLNIDEFNIVVNEELIYKPYSNIIYGPFSQGKTQVDKISNVEFEKFYNDNNEISAVLWYSICNFSKMINKKTNPMSGLRIRNGNIQIGDSTKLVKLFTEDRGNYYFFGELHCFDSQLIPNGRRDYFVTNDSLDYLEHQLFKKFLELNNLYRTASKYKGIVKKKDDFVKVVDEYKENSTKGFKTPRQKTALKRAIEYRKEQYFKGLEQLDKVIEKDDVVNRTIRNQYKTELKDCNVNNLTEIENSIPPEKQTKFKTKTDGLNPGVALEIIKRILNRRLPKLKAQELYDEIKEDLE